MTFLAVTLVLALGIGGLAAYAGHAFTRHQPWGDRLAVLVPLALIAGSVLALWSSGV